MIAPATTENPVAKKPAKQSRPSADPPFERVEFQAPIGFTARLDKVAKRRGLSRAGYIRQAILLLMKEDEKEE